VKDIVKYGIILATVAAISAAALSLTYVLTAPRIAQLKAEETRQALKEVLPEADSYKVGEKTIDGEIISYFIGRSGKNEVGRAVMVAPGGYAGPIEMLVGIDSNGTVRGVKILALIETPGLGLNASDSEFLSQFRGKTIDDKLKAKSDIDAITGATVTSQAAADGVREALEIFKKL
jgi:electron transport complex protein RnfG